MILIKKQKFLTIWEIFDLIPKNKKAIEKHLERLVKNGQVKSIKLNEAFKLIKRSGLKFQVFSLDDIISFFKINKNIINYPTFNISKILNNCLLCEEFCEKYFVKFPKNKTELLNELENKKQGFVIDLGEFGLLLGKRKFRVLNKMKVKEIKKIFIEKGMEIKESKFLGLF